MSPSGIWSSENTQNYSLSSLAVKVGKPLPNEDLSISGSYKRGERTARGAGRPLLEHSWSLDELPDA